jgi:hypothetical protein
MTTSGAESIPSPTVGAIVELRLQATDPHRQRLGSALSVESAGLLLIDATSSVSI